jgi:hypothetical protein
MKVKSMVYALVVVAVVAIAVVATGQPVISGYMTHTIATNAGAADYCDPVKFNGPFGLEVYGSSWTGTIRLFRSLTGPEGNFVEVATFTENWSDIINEQANTAWYKIGQNNGDYGSGSVTMTAVQ